MTQRRVVWMGSPPTNCDLCEAPIFAIFVDGKTNQGPWANMCLECHPVYGCGLGTGKGQKYQKQPNGEWLKIEG